MIRTFEYDGRNKVLVQVINLFQALGGRVVDDGKTKTKAKNGLDISLEEVKKGNVRRAKSVKDMMNQILGQ